MPPRKPSSPKGPQRNTVLFLIAIFKLVKGLALIALGIGALHLLHRDLGQTVQHWIEVLRIDPDNRVIHRLLVRVFRVSPKQLKAISAGTFLYAGVFLTEGTGLLLRKRWAEYFTIIATGSFIPIEVYEIFHRFTAIKVAVTIINIAIVVYLVNQVRKNR